MRAPDFQSLVDELQNVEPGDPATWPVWFRWMMVLVLSAGILYGGYAFFIQAQQRTLAGLQAKEIELKEVYRTKKKRAIDLPAYEEQMREIENRFGVVLKQLPDTTHMEELLFDITEVGRARGLVFVSFKPGETMEKEFYITLPFSVVVQGRYHQLAGFISDIAELHRIVTFGDLSLKGDDNANVTMAAELHTYQYVREKTE